jgi:photosynthetic reaction center cytochrome c subunit
MIESRASRITRTLVLITAIVWLISDHLTGSRAGARADVRSISDRRVAMIWHQAKPVSQEAKPHEKKAEEVYKSIQIFKGLPASAVMGAMEKISGFLGVDCDHCHVMGEFDKEDKKQKDQTRLMFRMVSTISRELNTNRVTCFTCHRGQARPEPEPAELRGRSEEPSKQTAEDRRPAEEAFRNIQVLKGMPAGQLTSVMSDFSSALGVDCTFCHDMTGFEKDTKPQKITTRKMLNMASAVAREHFGGKSPIGCYTCHRGKTQPVSTAAEIKK